MNGVTLASSSHELTSTAGWCRYRVDCTPLDSTQYSIIIQKCANDFVNIFASINE
jgi:hypothetical protein